MANPGSDETAGGTSSEQQKKAEEGGEQGGDVTKQRLEGKVDLALLNEDDDFEEFPAEEWDDVDPTTQTQKVWEDDWDDDLTEDDFSIELRAQLEKRGYQPKPKAPTSQPMESG